MPLGKKAPAARGVGRALSYTIRKIPKNENTVAQRFFDILYEPSKAGMDCSTIRLVEGNNYNSGMNGVQQRNCMVKVAIRSQNSCTDALSNRKYRIVIVARITHSVKTHDCVSALVYQVFS